MLDSVRCIYEAKDKKGNDADFEVLSLYDLTEEQRAKIRSDAATVCTQQVISDTIESEHYE